MLPWTQLDTARVPGGDGELRLMQRGSEFSITLGNRELMNSRLSGSEEALATLALDRIGTRRAPHILIGGLGMGFTLRAALGRLGPEARVTVVELVPAVVAWAQTSLAELFGGSLSDPRIRICEEDVGAHMRANASRYDAILLDVDNGPEGFTRASNDALYALPGLGIARAALRGGGVLAVWSVAPDKAFTDRLRLSGFRLEEQRVRANAGRSGARHTIWLATRDDGRGPDWAERERSRQAARKAGARPGQAKGGRRRIADPDGPR